MWTRYLLVCLIVSCLYLFWTRNNELEYQIKVQDEVTYYICSQQIEQSKFNQGVINALRKLSAYNGQRKHKPDKNRDYSEIVARYKQDRGVAK